MRKIRRWFRNWLDNDMISEAIPVGNHHKQFTSSENHGFQLKVISAKGGTVVETERLDRKHDRFERATYVVTDDKDLGAELAKIITMEQLKA